jgi:hypothetical protein
MEPVFLAPFNLFILYVLWLWGVDLNHRPLGYEPKMITSHLINGKEARASNKIPFQYVLNPSSESALALADAGWYFWRQLGFSLIESCGVVR